MAWNDIDQTVGFGNGSTNYTPGQLNGIDLSQYGYNPAADQYRYGFSTHQGVESGASRLMRWVNDVMRDNPQYDPNDVMKFELSRLQRDAQSGGYANQTGFNMQGINPLVGNNSRYTGPGWTNQTAQTPAGSTVYGGPGTIAAAAGAGAANGAQSSIGGYEQQNQQQGGAGVGGGSWGNPLTQKYFGTDANSGIGQTFYQMHPEYAYDRMVAGEAPNSSAPYAQFLRSQYPVVNAGWTNASVANPKLQFTDYVSQRARGLHDQFNQLSAQMRGENPALFGNSTGGRQMW